MAGVPKGLGKNGEKSSAASLYSTECTQKWGQNRNIGTSIGVAVGHRQVMIGNYE